MSRYVSNTNSKTAPTPYCKVCQDSGKPENVYRSHFTRETRDPNSRVTCPTLLALECRYCCKNGHTVKYCPILKNKDKQLSRPVTVKKSVLEVKTIVPALTNAFGCLHCDSDVEEQEQEQEQFPALCTPAKPVQVTNNYAAALAKPIPDPEPKIVLAPWANPVRPEKTRPEKPVTAVPVIRSVMTNWADDSDSEDEAEDTIPCPQLYRNNLYEEDW